MSSVFVARGEDRPHVLPESIIAVVVERISLGLCILICARKMRTRHILNIWGSLFWQRSNSEVSSMTKSVSAASSVPAGDYHLMRSLAVFTALCLSRMRVPQWGRAWVIKFEIYNRTSRHRVAVNDPQMDAKFQLRTDCMLAQHWQMSDSASTCAACTQLLLRWIYAVGSPRASSPVQLSRKVIYETCSYQKATSRMKVYASEWVSRSRDPGLKRHLTVRSNPEKQLLGLNAVQIAVLEERWADIEAGRGASTGQIRTSDAIVNQCFSRMAQYYTEGNQVTNGPLL